MPLTSSKAFDYCYYGYKAVQAGRIASGDVSALAEVMMEAAGEEISASVAQELASSFYEAYSSTQDFKKAAKAVSKRKCSKCRCVGHNARTCRGALREWTFGR
jgi:hypothetical protein